MPGQQQVAVELGVEVGDPVGDVQERDDVLEQARRGRRGGS